MSYLADINIWLALVFEAHVHHVGAAEWFDTLTVKSCAFCRFTQQGFLRLSTNPSVFGDEALTLAEAWTCFDELLSDDRTDYLCEPEGLEAAWRRHTNRRNYSHKVWSDAYIVSFAVAAGLKPVSFDRGFRDYKGVNVVVLQA